MGEGAIRYLENNSILNISMSKEREQANGKHCKGYVTLLEQGGMAEVYLSSYKSLA
jgi:hypothetical protein